MEKSLKNYLENIKTYDQIRNLKLSLDLKITNAFSFNDLLAECLHASKNLRVFELSNSVINLNFF